MNTYEQIATKIIKEQELVIGPMAWSSARKVSGLRIVDQSKGTVAIEGSNTASVIDGLVLEYEHLFGRASREVCRDAASGLLADLPQNEVPTSLR